MARAERPVVLSWDQQGGPGGPVTTAARCETCGEGLGVYSSEDMVKEAARFHAERHGAKTARKVEKVADADAAEKRVSKARKGRG